MFDSRPAETKGKERAYLLSSFSSCHFVSLFGPGSRKYYTQTKLCTFIVSTQWVYLFRIKLFWKENYRILFSGFMVALPCPIMILIMTTNHSYVEIRRKENFSHALPMLNDHKIGKLNQLDGIHFESNNIVINNKTFRHSVSVLRMEFWMNFVRYLN